MLLGIDVGQRTGLCVLANEVIRSATIQICDPHPIKKNIQQIVDYLTWYPRITHIAMEMPLVTRTVDHDILYSCYAVRWEVEKTGVPMTLIQPAIWKNSPVGKLKGNGQTTHERDAHRIALFVKRNMK